MVRYADDKPPYEDKFMQPVGYVPDFMLTRISNQYCWIFDDGTIGREDFPGHGAVATWDLSVLTGAAPYMWRYCRIMTHEGRFRMFRGLDIRTYASR